MAHNPATIPSKLGDSGALGAVLEVNSKHGLGEGSDVGGGNRRLGEAAIVPAAAVPGLLLDDVGRGAIVEADALEGAAVAPRSHAQSRAGDTIGEVQAAGVPTGTVPGLFNDVEAGVLEVEPKSR